MCYKEFEKEKNVTQKRKEEKKKQWMYSVQLRKGSFWFKLYTKSFQ